MKCKLFTPFFALVAFTISLSTQATIINLTSNLDGAQANAGAGSGSLGTGIASMLYDDVSNEFSWDISWSGLLGNVTAAHFHGAALFNQNAGVQVTIPIVSNPTSGSATISAAQATDLLAGLWYINIHTDFSPSGEIRGQVMRVSEPNLLLLVLPLVMGLFYSQRRRHRF
ncbi:CHRD domain-containing protein [uncultured Paraglaciecola sp.]|uniref:CHRD domain-containing protein n=1 Tax=uncultured Paraglaciecola sp. TaxID=1765024 RepID=UPI0030DD918D|tara:strand:+ start:88701 stop:89210 length:510 start_codon:yes stop_codon:yes gene_type:complete